MGCHFLLQEIFPTQGSNPGLPHYKQMLYHLSHQGRVLGLLRTIQLQLLQCICWGIGLDYRNIEQFALEMKRDHSVVFEIVSKYCILDSFVDHDGYSISPEGLA